MEAARHFSELKLWSNGQSRESRFGRDSEQNGRRVGLEGLVGFETQERPAYCEFGPMIDSLRSDFSLGRESRNVLDGKENLDSMSCETLLQPRMVCPNDRRDRERKVLKVIVTSTVFIFREHRHTPEGVTLGQLHPTNTTLRQGSILSFVSLKCQASCAYKVF